MNKPIEDPKPHEPEKQAPIFEASVQQPDDPADDLPPENHGTSADHMVADCYVLSLHWFSSKRKG